MLIPGGSRSSHAISPIRFNFLPHFTRAPHLPPADIYGKLGTRKAGIRGPRSVNGELFVSHLKSINSSSMIKKI